MTSTAPLPSPVAHCEGVRRGESRRVGSLTHGLKAPIHGSRGSRRHADLQAQSTKVFPGTTTTNTIMIPARLTRAQQVTTAESSRPTVRPSGADLLTFLTWLTIRGCPGGRRAHREDRRRRDHGGDRVVVARWIARGRAPWLRAGWGRGGRAQGCGAQRWAANPAVPVGR